MGITMQNRTASRKFELQIGELVLYGVSSRDQLRIAEAMKREIMRLLAASNLDTIGNRSITLDHLNAGSFSIGANHGPSAIGRSIARQVVRQLPIAMGGGQSRV